MAYCTLDELKARYSERMLIDVSDRDDQPTGEIDAALVARAIADADAEIDGYLRGRYALPLQALPPQLVDLSLRIAIYKAHANVVTDKIRRDYEDAIKTLKLIAEGTVRLDVAGVEPASSGSSDVMMTETSRPMTVSSMRGFI